MPCMLHLHYRFAPSAMERTAHTEGKPYARYEPLGQ